MNTVFSTTKNLKTIDTKHSLRLCYGDLNKKYVHHEHNLQIKMYDGVFSERQCDQIIKNTKDIREPSFGNRNTALVFDSTLAQKLALIVCSKVTVTPYSLFGSIASDESLEKNTSVNDLFRVSEYTPGGCIKKHWDNQFSTRDKRSSMSLIVYLSDGGGTNFYNYPQKNMTHSIKAKKGRMVLFDQRLLHDSIPCDVPRFILRTDVLHKWCYDSPINWDNELLKFYHDDGEFNDIPIEKFNRSVVKEMIHSKRDAIKKNMKMFYKAERYFRHGQLMDLLGKSSDQYYERSTMLRMGHDVEDDIVDQKISEHTSIITGGHYSVKHLYRNGTSDVYEFEGELESSIKVAALVSLASMSTLGYSDYIADMASMHGIHIDDVGVYKERPIRVNEDTKSDGKGSFKCSKIESLNIGTFSDRECMFRDCDLNNVLSSQLCDIDEVYCYLDKKVVDTSPLDMVLTPYSVEFVHAVESFNHASCSCGYDNVFLGEWKFNEQTVLKRIVMGYTVDNNTITVDSCGWVNH